MRLMETESMSQSEFGTMTEFEAAFSRNSDFFDSVLNHFDYGLAIRRWRVRFFDRLREGFRKRV